MGIENGEQVFQFATDHKVISDEYGLTHEAAEKMWKDSLPEFIRRTEGGERPEMCIWENDGFGKKLKYVHADDCISKDGKLYSLVEVI